MRLLNRPLAFILAAALAAASVIVIIEVIAFAAHSQPLVICTGPPGTTGPGKPAGTPWWSGSGQPS